MDDAMKNNYTQQHIDQFFSRFRELPVTYKIEKVPQLLNNPDAKATHPQKQIKPFKFLLMTSILIIGLSTLWFWQSPNESVKNVAPIGQPIIIVDSNKNQVMPNADKITSKQNKPSEGSLITMNTEDAAIVHSDEKNKIVDDPIEKNIQNKPAGIQENSLSITSKKKPGNNKKSVSFSSKMKKDTIKVPIIELSKETLTNLGFKFYSDSVIFNFYYGCNKYVSKHSEFEYDIISDSAYLMDKLHFSREKLANRIKNGVNKIYINKLTTNAKICGDLSFKYDSALLIRTFTNALNGQLSTTTKSIWVYNEDIIDGKYPSLSISDIDLNILVPIKCEYSESNNNKISFYNHIFWIYPNEFFLNHIPSEIAMELRKDLNKLYGIEQDEKSSCTYLESCKSTLDVESMTVYPNPAKQSVTVQFSLPRETNGNISLVNISGAIIKQLVSESNFVEGMNSYTADILDVTPGIYLVMIQTENGFKTQRLIISR